MSRPSVNDLIVLGGAVTAIAGAAWATNGPGGLLLGGLLAMYIGLIRDRRRL